MFKPKGDKVYLFTRITAPWLKIPLKGPLCETERESTTQAAARTVALMHHCSQGYIEPKKLQLLRAMQESEPIGTLIRMCGSVDIEEPVIKTKPCKGATAEGLMFETTISPLNKIWGKKIVVKAKALSIPESKKNAAQKALVYIANKMLKDEITGPRT
jgi:hypothetical protein